MDTGRRPESASSLSSVDSLSYHLGDDIKTDHLDRVEFPKGKPLPPIGGGGGDAPGKHDIDLEDFYGEENFEDDADDRSTVSPAVLDTPGEGKARPKVVRSFRAEKMDEAPEKASPSPTRPIRKAKKDAPRPESPATVEKFKRMTFDGQELNFVTLDTQTDWDWVYYVRETGTHRPPVSPVEDIAKSAGGSPRLVGADKTAAFSEAEEGQFNYKTSTDTSSHPLPLSDEYGIPLLELSSDTEDSSDEESARKKTRDERNFIPSIGPPQILQYIRESEKQEMKVGGPESRLQPVPEEKDVAAEILQKGNCEFCGKSLLPFPTLDQQLQSDPSQLYCCSEYREFVEFSMKTAIEMENARKEIKLIDIKPHGHHGSKQDRKAAKEKAVLRMRQRELERKAQEASGLQAAQAFFSSRLFKQYSDRPHLLAKMKISPQLMENQETPPMIQANFRDLSAAADTYSEGLKDTLVTDEENTVTLKDESCLPLNEHMDESSIPLHTSNKSTPVKVGSGYNANNVTPNEETKSVSQKNAQKGHTNKKKGSQVQKVEEELEWKSMPLYYPEIFARQMKTINYQLSSVRCMEEGWTLPPPSPLDDELGDDVFTPEPIDPDLLIEGKLYERPIINKTYESGQKFLTIFPDGTGNVFYPSGHLAILIFSVSLGTYCYTIHDPESGMPIAGFDASGLGFCYYPHGGIRIYMDQFGGIELDNDGSRRRKWIWKDQVTHNHAPPFQSITFALNRNIAVRIISQDNVVITFSAQRRSCRFNMGTKLKVVAPENILPQEIEEERIYLKEKKVQVEALLDKVDTLLKFPNSPKIDKILPPLHISAQVHRNQKLRKEQAKAITARATKNKKVFPAVSVN